ncbi:MAG: hypothetical protein OXL37_09635 [Chloroflexota bacterium]|nr:hypothetical protein [Chloroflexota bacterium]MDE2960651.1 hypothetical protein [Chloroflexota bacterium]
MASKIALEVAASYVDSRIARFGNTPNHVDTVMSSHSGGNLANLGLKDPVLILARTNGASDAISVDDFRIPHHRMLSNGNFSVDHHFAPCRLFSNLGFRW